MTGSGKTGLCLAMIEEALLDGVPVIAIDPKGDLANLALTFPALRPADFEPWVDPETARRDGVTVAQLAATTAQRWRDGLAASGQSPDRIARLRAAAEVAIYTPGSDAGIPLSLLRSFRAPAAALVDDSEAWRDRVEAAASGLLSLIGVAADPLRSREHVLLSQLLDGAWRQGRDVELAALIQQVVKPPFAQVGAFDLETFFPGKARTELALQLNTLLASPSFAAWTRGEPLEIANLLATRDGKPRAAVMSIAHLSDPERMFFVTLLLQEIVSWMRAQQGTSSLRAIVFMDEVTGYLPPTAMPPSKKPMLTLLKQARAFGVGIVVATQNPVDLDYKALANAGTWLLGRLQTERDKARVLEGLEGASAASGRAFDRDAMEKTLAGLAPRQFVMNDVHDPHPILLQSRFALSYLAGPLTRAQIGTLAKPAPSGAPAPAPIASAGGSTTRPVVPDGLPELFAGTGALVPALVGVAKVHHVLAKADLDVWTEVTVVAPLTPASAGDFWEHAALVEPSTVAGARSTAPDGATFAALPPALHGKTAARLDEGLAAFLFRAGTLTLRSVPSLDLVSRPGETEEAFRARLALALREVRDAAVARLKAKYQPKLDALASKHRTALDRVERERSQARTATTDSAISFGASVLGALFGGRRGGIGRATSAARSVSRTLGQRGDVARAEDSAAQLDGDLRELEVVLAAETAAVRAAAQPEIETLEVKPKKADTTVTRIAILWRPA
jgi:hypothetical protein